jgi:hypothetical protein
MILSWGYRFDLIYDRCFESEDTSFNVNYKNFAYIYIYIYFKKGIEIKFVLVECWSFFKASKWLCGFWSNYGVTFHSVRTYSGPGDPIGCHIEIKLSLGKCQIKLASVLLEDFIFLYILVNWLVIVNVVSEKQHKETCPYTFTNYPCKVTDLNRQVSLEKLFFSYIRSEVIPLTTKLD